jgi:3-dehydroquinate synthase
MKSSVRTIQVKTGSIELSRLRGPGPASDPRSAVFHASRPQTNQRIFVLTSPEIWSLWADAFLESFPHDQIRRPCSSCSPGEEHKRLRTVERLAEQLAENHADRSSC